MKEHLALVSTLFCISGFADSAKECGCTQPLLKNPICLNEVYDVCGNAFGMRGDILYMNYTVPVLTSAVVSVVVDPLLINQELALTAKMSVGCNIAINYTMGNQPGYSFEASWYHIVTQFKRHVSGSILLDHAISLTDPALGTVSQIAHIDINFFDVLIQKNFGFGDWFSVMPSVGLIGGYMNSVNRASTVALPGENFGNDTTEATLNQFLKYEGAGLKIGGKSSFRIGCGFKLAAELFYSALYGYSKDKVSFESDGHFEPPSPLSGTIIEYTNHHGRSFVDSLIGLAWESRFRNDSLFLELHAGWKFQSFSDGWMEFEAEFNDEIHTLPLYGQGLQAGATFKF